MCDLLLTVVQVSSILINIKPKLCFINMINMSYCGKSHWNGVKSSLLTKSLLKNDSVDFAQNFTNKRQKTLLIVIMKHFFIFMN